MNKNIKKAIFIFLTIVFLCCFYKFYLYDKKLFQRFGRSENQEVEIVLYDKKSDIEGINKIIHDNFFWIVHGITEEEYQFPEKLRAGVVSFAGEDANRPMGVFVAKKKSKIVGFVTFFIGSDSKIGRLHLLGVDKDARRFGVGEKLCRAAVDELLKNGCDIVWLMVLKENVRAQNLYKKIGFIERDDMVEQDDVVTIFVLNKQLYCNKDDNHLN